MIDRKKILIDYKDSELIIDYIDNEDKEYLSSDISLDNPEEMSDEDKHILSKRITNFINKTNSLKPDNFSKKSDYMNKKSHLLLLVISDIKKLLILIKGKDEFVNKVISDIGNFQNLCFNNLKKDPVEIINFQNVNSILDTLVYLNNEIISKEDNLVQEILNKLLENLLLFISELIDNKFINGTQKVLEKLNEIKKKYPKLMKKWEKCFSKKTNEKIKPIKLIQ